MTHLGTSLCVGAVFLSSLVTLPSLTHAGEQEVWAETAKLTAADGGSMDQFGYSVSLDGSRLAVGALFEDQNGSDSGAVYVFEQAPDGAWEQVSKLGASDGGSNDSLGTAVSLEGDHIAALGDSSVYIFERDSSDTWQQTAKLLADDGTPFGSSFGRTVSIEGDRVAVGASSDDDNGASSGAVYVFERDGAGNWAQVAKLLADDGQILDQLGSAVSLSGDRIAAGAKGVGGPTGGAYIFERLSDGSWTQAAKLVGSGPIADVDFGYSISLDGDRVAVGTFNPSEVDGAAYVFDREVDGSWSQTVRLTSPAPDGFGYFGQALSLDDDLLAVSAYGEGDSAGTGKIYVFDRSGGSWEAVVRGARLDEEGGDNFGYTVSLDGERLAGGSRGDAPGGQLSGSASILESVLVSPQLALSGSCPGEITLLSTGSTPRAQIAIYGSESLGTSVIDSGPCAGELLGLDEATSLRVSVSDFDAEGVVVRTIDSRWCGTYLQTLDETTCLTSPVAQIP